MKATHPVIIAAALCIYLASCTGDKGDEPVPVDTSCTHGGTDSMSYSSDIVPIMNTYCTNADYGDCHSPAQSSALDFTNYDILAFECDPANNDGAISKVEDRVFGDPPTTGARMPDGSSSGPLDLDPCDAEKLLLWIHQGFPNN